MKKTLSLIIFIFSFCSMVSQDILHNLEKYWYFRDRQKAEFVIIDNPDLPGTNIPFRRLTGVFVKNNGQTKFGWYAPGGPGVNGIDGPMGTYLALLATEYRLLKDYGQDYSQTLIELYYALYYNSPQKLDNQLS